MHSDAGVPLPLTFYGSKAGATFCIAMFSIGSGLKSSASQRCRNSCLTVKIENGARQIFRFAPTPLPWCAGGGGTFRLAIIPIGSGLKSGASQRYRNVGSCPEAWCSSAVVAAFAGGTGLIRRPLRAARRWDHRSRGRWFPASCIGRAGQPIHRSAPEGLRQRA